MAIAVSPVQLSSAFHTAGCGWLVHSLSAVKTVVTSLRARAIWSRLGPQIHPRNVKMRSTYGQRLPTLIKE